MFSAHRIASSAALHARKLSTTANIAQRDDADTVRLARRSSNTWYVSAIALGSSNIDPALHFDMKLQ
jgi:hypothetical protein